MNRPVRVGPTAGNLAPRAGVRAPVAAVAARRGNLVEVRVGRGRIDVLEIGGDGSAARALGEALTRLGLLLEEEFTSPCG